MKLRLKKGAGCKRVPANKVENLRPLGAEPVISGASQDEAEEFCFRKSTEEGWAVINPFDDPHVIAGQGTIGLELLEQLPEMDTVIVPVGSGLRQDSYNAFFLYNKGNL